MSFSSWTRAVCLVTLLVTNMSIPLPAAVSAPRQCMTDWFVSYGGVEQYQLLWTDPDGIPVEQLRFDYGYNDPFASAGGYIDFNANRKSDVFSAVPRSDGALQWRYWDVTTGGWVNLTYADDPLDGLRFGDFDGDDHTDVFSTALRGDGNYQWRYSSGGTANYQNLNYANLPIQSLRFGNFNGDSKTDVFAALLQPGAVYNWVYSLGGTGSFQIFASGQDANTAGMLLGDTQPESAQGAGSDGKTDIFLILPQGGPLGDGSPEYVWRSPLVAQYLPATAGIDRTALRLGNFNGDAYTDIFYQDPGPNNSLYYWRYISGKDFSTQGLNSGVTPVSDLRFGDFNGDGKTDVFLAVPHCSVYLPTVVR